MKRLVDFPLDKGGTVVVETDEPPRGPVTRGLGKERSTLAEKADKMFEEANAAVTPAARSLIARLRSIDDAPNEAGVEFGVQLSAQTGAFIALRGCQCKLQGVDDLAAPGSGNLNGEPWTSC
jgi:Trypsin-co-occurring domain 1